MQVTECPFSNGNGSLKPKETQKSFDSEDMNEDKMEVLPGPRGAPLVGQFFNLDTDNLHMQFMEWQKAYGDLFMFKVFGQHYVVISHPDILKEMFVTCEHAHLFNDRPASFISKYVIDRNKDILFRKCDDKQQIIKMAALNYIETELLNGSEKWFYDNVIEEFEELNTSLVDVKDAPVDITKKMDLTIAKVIALLLLGRRVKYGDPEFQCLFNFMKAGNEMAKVKNQTILTKFPGMRRVPGHLKDMYDSMCEEKSKLKEFYLEGNKCEKGLIAKLKQFAKELTEKENESWLNEEFLLGVIMDLTAAAVVPLQNTLSALFLVLIHYPLVQESIRNEIRSMTSSVTIDDKINMPYCSACLLEIKRYHTPLAMSARHSNRASAAQFESYNIPHKTQILSNLFGMHHDERFWPDPWRFKPERFLTGSGVLIRHCHPNMLNLVVSGVGPRRCLGAEFSTNVMFLAMTTILNKFHIRPCDTEVLPPCDPRQFLPGVVLRPPSYKCVVRQTNQIYRTNVIKVKNDLEDTVNTERNEAEANDLGQDRETVEASKSQ
ncbi:hypothetical protein ACF0H5_012607 [Mactra antiquata]